MQDERMANITINGGAYYVEMRINGKIIEKRKVLSSFEATDLAEEFINARGEFLGGPQLLNEQS
jgi:hypothetical protein